MEKNRKERRANKSGPANHCVAAATMMVTVAVDAARARGYMRFADVQRMDGPDTKAYFDLCAREWGITTEDPSEYNYGVEAGWSNAVRLQYL